MHVYEKIWYFTSLGGLHVNRFSIALAPGRQGELLQRVRRPRNASSQERSAADEMFGEDEASSKLASIDNAQASRGFASLLRVRRGRCL